MKYVAILLALVVLTGVYFLVWKRKINTAKNYPRTTQSNVISMDSHRKAKQSPGSSLALLVRRRMES